MWSRCETSAVFLSCRNAAYGHLPLFRTGGPKQSLIRTVPSDESAFVTGDFSVYFLVVINVKREVSGKASFSLNERSSRPVLTFGKHIATRGDLLRE